jgi:hypothetical protein
VHDGGGRSEGEVAVIAFVEGLDERKSGRTESGIDLVMRDSWSTDDVDRSAEQMIAVGHPADFAIVRQTAQGACDRPERGSDLGRSGCPADGIRGGGGSADADQDPYAGLQSLHLCPGAAASA